MKDGATNGWEDNGGRFPFDQKLRKNGFVILSRPKHGQILWTRNGEVYTQKQALDRCLKVLVTK